MSKKKILDSLNEYSKTRRDYGMGFFCPANEYEILDYALEEYRKKYFSIQKVNVLFDTEEFFDYLRQSWYFIIEAPTFLTYSDRHNKFMVRLIIKLIAEHMIGEYKATIIHDHYLNNVRLSRGEPKDIVNPYNEEVQLKLCLPISYDNMPTFEEFFNEFKQKPENKYIGLDENEKKVNELKRCIKNLSMNRPSYDEDNNPIHYDDDDTYRLYIDEKEELKTLKINKIIEEEEKRVMQRLVERYGTTDEVRPDITAEEMMKMYRSYVKSKGRSKNCKINKYDSDMNLIETYNSRQECIEKNELKKAALSLHLAGKRYKLNGYIYREVY